MSFSRWSSGSRNRAQISCSRQILRHLLYMWSPQTRKIVRTRWWQSYNLTNTIGILRKIIIFFSTSLCSKMSLKLDPEKLVKYRELHFAWENKNLGMEIDREAARECIKWSNERAGRLEAEVKDGYWQIFDQAVKDLRIWTLRMCFLGCFCLCASTV